MKLLHVAIQMEKSEEAHLFFEGILKLKKVREYTLKSNLAEEIFGIKKDFIVYLYALENGYIEVFIGEKANNIGMAHIALAIKNRKEVVNTAKEFGLSVYEKERKGRDTLTFIKDPSGNLYELKEG